MVERISARARLRRCTAVGDGARVVGTPVVANLGRITVGRDLSLSSVPVTSHLVTGIGGWLEIGDRVSIAHGAAVASHAHVRIEDDVHLGPFVMIMDTNFHEAGDHGTAPVPRPILVEAGARIGARVTILPGASIGAGATVAPGSVVSGRVVAGACVAGVPARESAAPPLADMEGSDPALIPEIVRRTFGLTAVPDPASGPNDLLGWDSLGTLNLLLSLEEAFGVALDPAQMLGVRCVADLAAVVASARRPAAHG